MRRKISTIYILFFALAGCTPFKKGEGDLLYRLIQDSSGETIQEGEVVELSVTAKTEEDSLLWSTDDYDRPALVKREKSFFKGDLFAALGLLSQGDSAVIKVNIDSMKIKMGIPRPTTTNGNYLVYSMRIHHVVHKGQLTSGVYIDEVNQFLKERLDRLKIEEPVKINHFITSRHWTPFVTGSGLQYAILQKGRGSLPEPADTLEVNYTGKLMSGKVFTSTDPDVAKKANVFRGLNNPCKITYDPYGPNRGFNEMMMKMPKGSKMTAIIPSSLAYGREGAMEGLSIQEYTPLVYEMEMVNIIHPKLRNLRMN